MLLGEVIPLVAEGEFVADAGHEVVDQKVAALSGTVLPQIWINLSLQEVSFNL